MLHELGVSRTHEAVRGGVDLLFDAWRDDGRIRLGPKAPLYPCYTAEAARVLCRFGHARDERVRATTTYFLENAHETGGWRCQFTRFGKGPETRFANPGATLFVLDALRHDVSARRRPAVGPAVESLLAHWTTRKPIGPCHYGIGSLFMQVEFPFLRYNLFYFVYVLSFYPAARRDPRFREALETLRARLDASGRVMVERPHRSLAALEFCRKGHSSATATARFQEILNHVKRR